MMATNGKLQNISIQPAKHPRTSKTIYELPRENLTEADLVKKSTSDRTKRRVAHKAWFPLPVVTKPVATEKPEWKPKKKHVLRKDRSILRVKPCKVRQITETVALDSARVGHSQSSSSGIEGVDDRVKADKRKSGDLGGEEVIKKKQKKGVDNGVKVDKRKSGDLDCGEVIKKKQKKGNVDKSKKRDVKREKKSRPRKGPCSETSAGKVDLKIRISILEINFKNSDKPNVDGRRNLFAQRYQMYTNRIIKH